MGGALIYALCFGGLVVPEGLADRSLAIYCQEKRPERRRPVGMGMIEALGVLLQWKGT
jgi:hypothetical protein